VPLYEVVVSGTVNGQQAIQKTNWEFLSPGPLASQPAYRLLQAMGFDESDPTTPLGDSILEAFVLSNTGYSIVTNLFSRNLFDPLDFIDIPLATGWVGGQAGGSYTPSFNAAQWRSSRTNANIRRAHTSTWGLREADVDDSANITGVNLIAYMDDWAARMSLELDFVVGVYSHRYRNCLCSQERYMVPGTGTDAITNPARWAYAYYETESEQMENTAFNLTWSRMTKATSRVSRKIGKGR